MPPQLREHAVASILRQCFLVPICRSSKIRRQPISRSSRPAPHIPNLYLRPRHRLRRISIQSKSRFLTTSSHVKSTSLSASELQEYQPALLQANKNLRPTPEWERVGKQQQIAVLGGGITGLSTAHYLAKEIPDAKITIYEGSGKFGGWLNSQKVDLGNGHITVEQGPRTLRPGTIAALALLEMIQDLGLEGELLITDKSTPAAQNRFIYYPNRLVLMPGPGQQVSDIVWKLMTDPLFKGFLYGMLTEIARPGGDRRDESIGSFLERRLGSSNVGDNVVSAVFHGIYAGDIYQLSARSLMGSLYQGELEVQSLLIAQMKNLMEGQLMTQNDANLGLELTPKVARLIMKLANASVYSFKTGIGALTQSLAKSLQANTNVTFKPNEKIASMEYDFKSRGMKVTSPKSEKPTNYNHVISTISSKHLCAIVPGVLPSLAETPSVTVMVVNLFFSDPHLLPEQGFGYLIPRSIPFEQNPECALGVVFDSYSSVGQDTVPGTKLTVMIGGHWWDGRDEYPNEEEGQEMARAVLERHLGIKDEPLFVKVGIQKDCIPQYTVGHDDRMIQGHEELMAAFKGTLLVAGNSYTGVGVNDCVRGARDVVMSLKKDSGQATGLEGFRDRKWVRISPLPTKRDN